MKRLFLLVAVAISAVALRAEGVKFEANVTEPGQLLTVIGDNVDKIDTLVVKGPVNKDDFATMWHECFYGKLTVIDLKEAQIEGQRIPDHAFYNSQSQIVENKTIHLKLRKIVLPDNLQEIGSLAFCRTELESLELPSGLKTISNSAFLRCYSLTGNVVLPEGLTTLERGCFQDCHELQGVEFPSTLKSIGNAAFYQTAIKSVILPEGVEQLGTEVFAGSQEIEEAVIPGTLKEVGYAIFGTCTAMKKLTLGEGLETVPEGLASDCIALEEVKFPSTIKEIGKEAFYNCDKLINVDIPEGVTTIDDIAFYNCDFEKIVIPSTVLYLGKNSFYTSTLKAIYSKAAFAPLCGGNDDINAMGGTPFGAISVETPIYIPIGSKANYQATAGWNRFTNFIETNDFSGVASADLPASRAYWKDGSLVVECAGADVEKCEIYTLDGRLAASVSIGMGATEVALPCGSYIVRMGNEVLKIK